MRLYVLEGHLWDIVAEGDRNQCPLVEWLDSLDEQYQASVDGLLRMFERAAQHGPNALGDKLCHEVDKQQKLYEFIKGDLRVIWFYGRERIVCCSHGLIKKTQATPKKEKAAALRMKQRYEVAVEQGEIQIFREKVTK